MIIYSVPQIVKVKMGLSSPDQEGKMILPLCIQIKWGRSCDCFISIMFPKLLSGLAAWLPFQDALQNVLGRPQRQIVCCVLVQINYSWWAVGAER